MEIYTGEGVKKFFFIFTFVKGYSRIAESSYFKTFLTRERFSTFFTMSYPSFSSIFNRIRREAGLEALKLARTMEKTTYKLEAHHHHLHFTHKAIENQWIPKSLRFKPPGIHPVFKLWIGPPNTVWEQESLFATIEFYSWKKLLMNPNNSYQVWSPKISHQRCYNS